MDFNRMILTMLFTSNTVLSQLYDFCVIHTPQLLLVQSMHHYYFKNWF